MHAIKRKSFYFVLGALVLALALWGGSRLWESRNPPQVIYIEEWGDFVPQYRAQDVTQFFLINPQRKTCLRVEDPYEAQKILEELGQYRLETAPSNSSDCGFLVLTPTGRFSLYVVDGPETEKGSAIRSLAALAAQNADPYVDAYQLLTEAQIERVTFSGTNSDDTGSATSSRTLSLDTTDPKTIEAVLQALRNFQVGEMTLYPADTPANLPTSDQIDAYMLTLHLGEVYGYQTCKIVGFRYAFALKLDFQSQERLYTCEYPYTKTFMNQIENLKETVVGLRGAAGQSIPQATSEAAGETGLPDNDKIPLPDGLQLPG